ncbi:MAG: uracil-DNA glycosylase [Pseudomonadota bacterium]
MPNPSLATFLRDLQATTPPHTFNPWTTHDPGTDHAQDAPAQRLQRLQAHLDCDARIVLIGEASGYQGCHVTGIPFTSERLLIEGAIPRVTIRAPRLSTRTRPWSEPSATIVWGILKELGIADSTVLWNAYPWHPHQPRNHQSNRTPTTVEKALGLPVLETFLALYPAARLFAVGRNAERALALLGQTAIPLRHPAMGGASLFRSQLRAAL